ncbi:MAG: phosphoribosyltransferase domain-containing protein [Cyanobacteria bacterium P01_D01_bin.123]
MHEISVTWADYRRKVEELAVKVYNSGWEFNQIVCLAKGGLRIGDTFARIFDLPLAILSASSYGGPDGKTRGPITFSRDLSMTTANLGSHILLVDDLADSGITLKKGVDWLKYHYGFYIEDIRTATIWYKALSTYTPNYYVDFLPDNPWIHQPFEPYDRLTIAELARSLDENS